MSWYEPPAVERIIEGDVEVWHLSGEWPRDLPLDVRRCATDEPNKTIRDKLLVVTNPVEATATWLSEETEWKRSRLVGLGATVETTRFSRFVADWLNVDATSVWTEIIGEHGPLIELRDKEAFRNRVASLTTRAVYLNDLLDRMRGAAAELRKPSEAVGRRQANRSWMT